MGGGARHRFDSGNTQGQRDLQRNFFTLENIFPYSLPCADFFFCLSDHRKKTKGKLWGHSILRKPYKHGKKKYVL